MSHHKEQDWATEQHHPHAFLALDLMTIELDNYHQQNVGIGI